MLRAAQGAGLVVRALPGVAGALLVCVGLGLAWLPLGLVAAGGFLLAIDARIPTRSLRRRRPGRPRTGADAIALRRRMRDGA